MQNKSNKLKIFNDPVYGFISIPDEVIFDLIEEKSFQRLRRIVQTGLANYVYPGANHSRFLHALGCLHLMQKAVDTLRQKNVKISDEEESAVYMAILLHDIGHGPFSHALESTIVEGGHHEDISLRIMQGLNEKYDGKLDLAIQIFQKKYPRKFLSQLIASQLDIDRLDYLKRDSFFTGVTEGNIGSDRIISMMNVHNNELVIDVKGIYSVEKYLIARMFMYWQVYLHKTSVAAELYLIQALKRAKELHQKGIEVGGTPALMYFINRGNKETFTDEDLRIFLEMDDSDIMYSLKQWQNHPDKILNTLSTAVVQRNLPRAEIRNFEIHLEELKEKRIFIKETLGADAVDYFVHITPLEIIPYNNRDYPILLYNKDGDCVDIAKSDKQILTRPLFEPTQKYHFCYLDDVKLKKMLARN
ncbi:HD domain-containing protein [Flavobacteriaceae bacterium Ap0902]|nr:HD domain-containing protein [Flavobacteriaceae bacterium Ap0902]